MKIKPILLLILLAASGFLITIVPEASATTTVPAIVAIDKMRTSNLGSFVNTITLNGTYSAGEWLLMDLEYTTASAGAGTPTFSFTVSDTANNNWVYDSGGSTSGGFWHSESLIYHGHGGTTTVGDVVTITETCSVGGSYCLYPEVSVSIIQASGVGLMAYATSGSYGADNYVSGLRIVTDWIPNANSIVLAGLFWTTGSRGTIELPTGEGTWYMIHSSAQCNVYWGIGSACSDYNIEVSPTDVLKVFINPGGCCAGFSYNTVAAEFDGATAVTMHLKITPNEATAASATLTGCGVVPTTVAMDSNSHAVTALPTCSVTVTPPADSSYTRYRFTGGVSSVTEVSCASGSCSEQDITVYKQVYPTFIATPTTPTAWDGPYTILVTGPVVGSTTTVATISALTHGGFALSHGWMDSTGTATFPSTFNSVSAGYTWVGQAPTSFATPTGGGSYEVDYVLEQIATITVITSPTGLIDALYINDTACTSPCGPYPYVVGDHYNITAVTTVGTTYLYTFSHWSDSGAREHYVPATTLTGPVTYIAYYTGGGTTSCGLGTPLQLLQAGCFIQAIVTEYGGPIGIPFVLAWVFGDIDMAIFLKGKNALIAILVFDVGILVLGTAIPGPFGVAAYIISAICFAGIIWKAFGSRG